MVRILSFKIEQEDNGVSVGNFLKAKGFSRQAIVSFKKNGGMEVNGAFRRMIDPLKEGDIITLELSDEASVLTPNGDLKLRLLYEDDDIVALDKEGDMLVHPATREFRDAVGNYFAFLYPDCTFRPIGRLDRDTTGICISAKNRLAAAKLNGNGKIEKTYYAIVEGLLPEDSGTVNAPLVRVPGSIIMRQVDDNGKAAVTHYKVLERGRGHSFVELKLETGRTHQIRVHMAYLGYPLAGDTLYGGGVEFISRQALHCGKAEFCHPITGKNITIISPLPADMAKLKENL